MSKWIVLTLIAVGCVLLAVGNGALWLELNVFNADRFGDHVVQGLQSPAASDALAEKVVDVLMAEMPDLPPLARLPAREVVSWSLQRPLFAGPFQETAALALNAMTTSTEDVVGIDLADKLSTLGATVAGAIAVVAPESGEAAQDAISAAIESSQVSGRLAVYESGRFPKLRTLSSIAPWAAL
ncbi:MAG: hypothetical protein ACK2UL_03280, partial [Anaerolineae bacterium]